MAHVIADRVSDTSTTTGTGAFTVSGSAPTGFRTLSTVLANADTFYYVIAHQSANEWEVGLGTHSGGNVFARTTPIASSNGGAAVDFASGTKDVFLSQPAARDNPRISGVVDNTLPRFDGTAGNLQSSSIVVEDTTNDVSGIGNIQITAGSALRAGTTATNTLLLQARDVDGAAWTTAVRLTSADTPLFELVSLDLDTNGRAILFDDATGIKDDSGNETIRFRKAASAVNQIDVYNASTGNGPTIVVTGDDTNIDLTLAGKGTGGIVLVAKASTGLGLYDSNSSHALQLKTSSNLTATRQVDFVTGDGDRSVGLDAWTATTPTVTARGTAGAFAATCSMRHQQIGKTVFVYLSVAVTNVGTATGWSVPPPITPQLARNNIINGVNDFDFSDHKLYTAGGTPWIHFTAAGAETVAANTYYFNGSYEAA